MRTEAKIAKRDIMRSAGLVVVFFGLMGCVYGGAHLIAEGWNHAWDKYVGYGVGILVALIVVGTPVCFLAYLFAIDFANKRHKTACELREGTWYEENSSVLGYCTEGEAHA